jgi:hypothetical protein
MQIYTYTYVYGCLINLYKAKGYIVIVKTRYERILEIVLFSKGFILLFGNM